MDAQGFNEGQIGQAQRAFLVAVANKGQPASTRHVSDELLAQRSLPDARLTNHHDERAAAGSRGAVRGVELLPLVVAPDERYLLQPG